MAAGESIFLKKACPRHGAGWSQSAADDAPDKRLRSKPRNLQHKPMLRRPARRRMIHFLTNGKTPMPAKTHLFLCLTDNFGVLLHDPASGATAAIDAPEAAPVDAALKATGGELGALLATPPPPQPNSGESRPP